MTDRAKNSAKYLPFAIWTLVVAGLYAASLYSFLLFHSLAEIFSIVIAVGVFAIAWNSRRFLDNNYLLFLGIAYLFVGLIDLVHTLAYKGMGIFPGYGANLPTQFWIAGRGLEAVSLFLAPLFLQHRVHPTRVFFSYFFISALLLLLIFGELFPICYVEGVGLTTFKKVSEYVICVILAGAMGLLWSRRQEFDRGVLRLIVWSIALTIGSELAFTFYLSVYGFSNLVGHIFKILSFYLIYKALIETGLAKPYDLMFRNLKLSEEALRKERDFVASLINTAQVIVLVLDPQGRILRFNPYLEQVSGYRLEEVQGRDWVATFMTEPDRGRVRRLFAKAIGGSGTLVHVHPLRTRDGSSREIEWYNRMLLDSQGSLVGLLAIGHDITGQKQAEREIRKLNRELEEKVKEVTHQAADLAAANKDLESFSYSVSHDLRAPLRGISGFARILEEDFGARLGPEGLEYLKKIQDSARQMGELMDALLQLSRMIRAEVRRLPVDLSALARLVATDLKNADPQREAAFVIADGLTAAGDPVMLRLMMENLLGNAWKFTARTNPARIEFGAAAEANGCRVFFVRDNGVGFDMNYSHKLFRPFQRLHLAREFPGTGVGLATVERIIQRHRGRVWAEGAPGRGATFYFTLPSREDDPEFCFLPVGNA